MKGWLSYTAVVTAPTCTEEGYTTYTCACGDTYVADEVAALDHSFTKYESDGNATCTADGTKTAKCDRCDVTDTIADVGSALGHTRDYYEYNESGHWSICSKCGEKFDSEDHEIINNACECGLKNVEVIVSKNEDNTAHNINYTVFEQTVTVSGDQDAVIVYYKDADGKNQSVAAIENADGSYSYTIPAEVTAINVAVKGDYNSDGKLDQADFDRIKAVILETANANATDTFIYDISGEGKITALDLALINAALKGNIALW